MQELLHPQQPAPPDAGWNSVGAMLLGIFYRLDQAQIRYCVTHGYQYYLSRIPSDVDCVVSAEVSLTDFAALFEENHTAVHGRVVRWRESIFVFAKCLTEHAPEFLVLDIGRNCDVTHLPLYTSEEILEGRRRHGAFWVPSPAVEFGITLARRIAKGRLDEAHCEWLCDLYRQDAVGCERQLARFWTPTSAALMAAAGRTGDWQPVRKRLSHLRSELRRRTLLRHPVLILRKWVTHTGVRLAQIFRPESGISVAFLGPDGAGKSSTIAATLASLSNLFARNQRHGFAPGLLHNLLRRPKRTNSEPHAMPPRSALMSIVRALGYWLPYYLLIYPVTVRLALAHSSLLLHDRHLVDALVDPRRYRYGGPAWIVRLIWRLTAKPDLIILLDASPDVLHSRKQEVSFAEITRQQEAYLALIRSLPNGYVVDAAQPLDQVVRDVNALILRHMACRVSRRLADVAARDKGRTTDGVPAGTPDED